MDVKCKEGLWKNVSSHRNFLYLRRGKRGLGNHPNVNFVRAKLILHNNITPAFH